MIDSEDIESLAASVPTMEVFILFPALTGLGAPHWDQYARGAILGITREQQTHIARATIEGITYQVYDLVKSMEADFGKRKRVKSRRRGSCQQLMMQFQSDLFGFNVRPKMLETTALGLPT
jgi:glycerol kinase